MRLRIDGENFVGSALDLRDRDVAASEILDELRPDGDTERVEGPRARIQAHVGHIHPEMSLALPRALAAAARSRGETTAHRETLEAIDAELAATPPERVDLRAARRRVAEAGADVAERREAVARTSGRVAALRDAGLDDGDATEQLRTATRDLSEAETKKIAAEQALASERRRARDTRDDRERRLKLTDRRRNIARRAREELVAREAERFERAVAALPVQATPAPPEAFEGSDSVAALAIARLADLLAPVVIQDGPFRHAAQARACLAAPVVLL